MCVYIYINIFNQDMTNILCKKKRKGCDKHRNGGLFFTQTQISIISNLCCENQALIHVQFSYFFFSFLKCYCTLICFIVFLLSVITIIITNLLILSHCPTTNILAFFDFLRLKTHFFFLLLLLLLL